MLIKGSIVEIVRNDERRYDGTLTHYFRVVFFHAQNLRHPYHNFRHMLHVLWLCYQAAIFYEGRLQRREVRNLLIAALFHDYDHSGQFGNDDLNIERALRGLRKHIQPEDTEDLASIEGIIRRTEFPYTIPSEHLRLPAQILRDADVMQALNVAWIQQVVIGLATEWSKSPIEVLRAQGGFHRNLKFSTEWARTLYPPEKVAEKIAEAEALLELLGEAPKS